MVILEHLLKGLVKETDHSALLFLESGTYSIGLLQLS